jgi:RNA binding exosome subunit
MDLDKARQTHSQLEAQFDAAKLRFETERNSIELAAKQSAAHYEDTIAMIKGQLSHAEENAASLAIQLEQLQSEKQAVVSANMQLMADMAAKQLQFETQVQHTDEARASIDAMV